MSDHERVSHRVEAAEEHLHLPSPSIWPLTLAFGVTIMGLGVLTNVVFIIFGAMVSIAALAKWAGEMRHE
jgi:cytochrome c oxidase subunit 1